MKTDKEVLEKAAKAAGLEFWYGEPMKQFMDRSNGNRRWNPLTDDGDALRLAVKLKIQPTIDDIKCHASWWIRPDMTELDSVVELINDDPYAATRRAIVRAAAAIEEAK